MRFFRESYRLKILLVALLLTFIGASVFKENIQVEHFREQGNQVAHFSSSSPYLEQFNEDIVYKRETNRGAVLVFFYALLNRLFLWPKTSIPKEDAGLHRASYEFLRLNILASKHHPPTL